MNAEPRLPPVSIESECAVIGAVIETNSHLMN